jgi:hypothetical protein
MPTTDPVITSVVPQPVAIGQTLSIEGRNLSPRNAVGFHPGIVNGQLVVGTILSWTDDLVRVQVPPLAQSGPVNVVRADGKSASVPIAVSGGPPPPAGVNIAGKLTGAGAASVVVGQTLDVSRTGQAVGSLTVTQVAPAATQATAGEIGEAWLPEQNPGFTGGEIGEAWPPPASEEG